MTEDVAISGFRNRGEIRGLGYHLVAMKGATFTATSR